MSSRAFVLGAACLACACSGAARAPFAPSSDTPAVQEPQPPRDVESVLQSNPTLAPLVEQAATHRLQVLISLVSPSGDGFAWRQGFRVDAEYFYPASAIKLCTAAAALEALGELRDGEAAELGIDAGLASESATRTRNGSTSIANLVGGALVMSDNEANNDLFDLVGVDGLHERMWRLGLSSVRMRHRLGVAAGDDVRISPRVELLTGTRSFVIPPREGSIALGKNEQDGVLVGDSHVVAGRLVEEPMSFADKNRISLSDLQELMILVVRPELRPGPTLRLDPRDRAALVDSLATLPSSRGTSAAIDREHKPLLAGIERVIPRTSLTLASKAGRAYGFVVDNAYVSDARTGRAFFLTVSMYTNPNGRVNDDVYDYGRTAYPALEELGEVVARFALDE